MVLRVQYTALQKYKLGEHWHLGSVGKKNRSVRRGIK